MIVSVRHIFTGKLVERDLPVTQAQLDKWRAGGLVQDVFPHLGSDDREWLISGLSEEEWGRLGGVQCVECGDTTPLTKYKGDWYCDWCAPCSHCEEKPDDWGNYECSHHMDMKGERA